MKVISWAYFLLLEYLGHLAQLKFSPWFPIVQQDFCHVKFINQYTPSLSFPFCKRFELVRVVRYRFWKVAEP